MSTDRREFFRNIAAATTLTAIPTAALAREKHTARGDAVGLLYDATKCIGCKACVAKCKEVNDLPADTEGYGGGLYDAPESLNGTTKNVIQLYKSADEQSFVKKQCM